MKTATAKELRYKAAAILKSVEKGAEVTITMRGKSIAVLKPVREAVKQFSPVGFGIWKARKDLRNVTKWVSERRKERYQK